MAVARAHAATSPLGEGTGLSKFVYRFKRLERSTIAQGVAKFNEEVRAHKLLEIARIFQSTADHQASP